MQSWKKKGNASCRPELPPTDAEVTISYQMEFASLASQADNRHHEGEAA